MKVSFGQGDLSPTCISAPISYLLCAIIMAKKVSVILATSVYNNNVEAFRAVAEKYFFILIYKSDTKLKFLTFVYWVSEKNKQFFFFFEQVSFTWKFLYQIMDDGKCHIQPLLAFTCLFLVVDGEEIVLF